MPPIWVGLTLAFASALVTNTAYSLEHDAAAALPPLSPRRPFRSAELLLRDRRWLTAFGPRPQAGSCMWPPCAWRRSRWASRHRPPQGRGAGPAADRLRAADLPRGHPGRDRGVRRQHRRPGDRGRPGGQDQAPVRHHQGGARRGPGHADRRPAIGGVLVGIWDWRAIFWFNLLFGAAALGLGAAVLPESADPDARRVDIAGTVLGAVALSALVFAVMPLAADVQTGMRGCWHRISATVRDEPQTTVIAAETVDRHRVRLGRR